MTGMMTGEAQANANRRRGEEWDEDGCISERMGWQTQIGMCDK